ncbi:hypothetical protein EGR_09142 [Echinococcus granulosus]|uniref:Uncharacterized protein n=1 Tax=Echinococcus granulosus TaxID=6210 RepID=W6UCL5_ECHGR|nr:hypothetical protein EGR_09142 [Echinococcus granulosus]EUB56017.1 hypothetical protein EGR_09142 [Echinococcus granulosus]
MGAAMPVNMAWGGTLAHLAPGSAVIGQFACPWVLLGVAKRQSKLEGEWFVFEKGEDEKDATTDFPPCRKVTQQKK